MAVPSACFLASGLSPAIRRRSYPALRGSPTRPSALSSTRRFDVSTAEQISSAPTPDPSPSGGSVQNGRLRKDGELSGGAVASPYMEDEGLEAEGKGLDDFFSLAEDLIRSDSGPPRWFSPLECAKSLDNSPLLLYLPGIDGSGAGLAVQNKRLGKIFDIWCLHIPVFDRTSFTDLIQMIETTVRSESYHFPNRPIYLVGESLGACLALAVAARNPSIDLMLILANPATSFNASQVPSFIPLLEIMPDQVQLTHPFLLNLMRGDPLKILQASSEKVAPPAEKLAELTKDLFKLSSYVSILANILPKQTLLWKLQMLKSASGFTNSRLHAVKAQTLILISGRDQLLPSVAEASRLSRALQDCETRKYECGHFLFLEDGINLVTIIKGACFYRRGKSLDYVSDYLPPTYSEFMKIYNSNKFVCDVTAPVMLSTLESGKIVRGLAGIPSDGPVLLVGYHMLLGLELSPLVAQFFIERNIHLRGIAHPMMFAKHDERSTTSSLGPSFYDVYRIMGAVPVSGANFFKLFSRKSHVLLYPGGMREALHRKGEEYKLFWPEQSEFVRMAARFGTKIVPFGVVGEDDLGQVIFDYEDLMKIPYFRYQIRSITNENVRLRKTATGEVANQDVHLPGIMPKIPGRFYYFFGKPIETKGRKRDLKDREKSQELYLQVKSEVEKCIAYLKEKREGDPYRSIFSRIIYQTINGSSSEIPTFDP
ncbi:hypothetical protein SAY86_009674 [Trapa natans]|uniref:Serine aminopeptidase S33 domain-containing protein n=1 Tax=Trapa natans TaxID=22666 RepID=A0AAN7QPX6_TRANT|nr:hypothetical protein SAY86_009674 [Trapa natans]